MSECAGSDPSVFNTKVAGSLAIRRAHGALLLPHHIAALRARAKFKCVPTGRLRKLEVESDAEVIRMAS